MALDAPHPQSSLASRLLGALQLDAATYAEVAADDAATRQATGIVAVAATLGAVWAFVAKMPQLAALIDPGLRTFAVVFSAVLFIAVIVFSWILWNWHAGLLAAVSRWIEGIATRDAYVRLLRALGFAWTIQWF